RVRHAIKGQPRVSVVIPTAGKAVVLRGQPTWHVLNCVESVRRASTYRNSEILVVDNDDLPAELAKRLDDLGVVRVPYLAAGRFNLSAKMNLGAAKADGDQLVFLNDDTEIISADWLECLLEYAQQPDVGAVGAK